MIDSVVRTVCGSRVVQLARLTAGGMNETYRVELAGGTIAVVRIARQPVPWFVDEAHVMAQARGVGVPTPEVLGVEHVEHDGQLLSLSILRLVPGRALVELAVDLTASELERFVESSGELLARLHTVVPDRGLKHELTPPDEQRVAQGVAVAEHLLGPAAASTVLRGAERLREQVRTRPAPSLSLVHGDWLPKHLLINDGGITSVIDWEFAGPASPAYDLAHWELAAGDALHDRADLLRRGYSRVADPDTVDAGWVPAFAIEQALTVLAWKNPASPAQIRRCVEVIARHVNV